LETDYRERFNSGRERERERERERAAVTAIGIKSQNENYEYENEEEKVEKTNITDGKTRWYLTYPIAIESLRLVRQRRGRSRKNYKW